VYAALSPPNATRKSDFLVAAAITSAHTQAALAQGPGKEDGEMTMPGWNCHVKVKNATEVGLGWAVTNDVPGDPKGYTVHITLVLPEAAGLATVVSKKPNETVDLNRDPNLACGPDGIQARITYRVSSNGGTGTQVKVQVANNAGMKPPPTGGILGQAAGQLDQDITFPFRMQGTCT
jgi:hypothetical protein